MHWLQTLMILLLGIGYAHLQCFTPASYTPPLNENADLSGVADLGFDLYRQFAAEKPQDNLFFSPYSIWAAFVLLYYGAAGNTQAQLERTLGLSDKVSAHQMAKGLEILYKQQSNANISLDVANRVYFNESFDLLPCVKTIFPDELQILNFYDATNSAKVMNSFVDQTTRGLISSIVTEEMIKHASTVLINAVYFKGFWKHEFKKSKTLKRTFTTSLGARITDMMGMTKNLKYGESTQLGARVLDLPYASSSLSMILILPNEGNSLSSVTAKLSSSALQDALSSSNMRDNLVELHLPKFQFRTEYGPELVKALKNIGITDVFDRSRVELTQFSSSERLLVTDVIHKAYVDVNEEGTEAAAATAIVGISITSIVIPPPLIEFHCNKPFLFLIYDWQTKNVLFVGNIKDPSKF